MKARYVALAAALAAFAGLVWWRRRTASPAPPAVQLGLSDGSVKTLPASDAATAHLQALAAELRAALGGRD